MVRLWFCYIDITNVRLHCHLNFHLSTYHVQAQNIFNIFILEGDTTHDDDKGAMGWMPASAATAAVALTATMGSDKLKPKKG